MTNWAAFDGESWLAVLAVLILATAQSSAGAAAAKPDKPRLIFLRPRFVRYS